jgi:hypothetical protein
MRATKLQHIAAVKAINKHFEFPLVALADWTDVGSGYAILVNDDLDEYTALDISADATVHGALPRGTYLEAINNFSLRLQRRMRGQR